MRSILTIALAYVVGLSGCVVTNSAREDGRDAAALTPVEVDSFWSVKRAMFSPDGRHFLAVESHQTLRLYDTESRKAVWSFKDPDELRQIRGADFIDANTYYVGMEAKYGNGAEVRFRTIDPSEETSVVEFENGRASDPLLANHDFIYNTDEIYDRRTGRLYPAPTRYPRGNRVVMTSHGKLFTTRLGGWARLNEPLRGDFIDWHMGADGTAFDITAERGHAITLGFNGQCTVWHLPVPQPAAQCGSAPWFGRDRAGEVLAHPQADRFAVSWGERVRVYDIDPFRLVFETRMDSAVWALAWSSNSRLAISTKAGTIEVWNIDGQRLIGTHTAPTGSEVLALSPEGDRLLAHPVDTHKLLLFELPRHP